MISTLDQCTWSYLFYQKCRANGLSPWIIYGYSYTMLIRCLNSEDAGGMVLALDTMFYCEEEEPSLVGVLSYK